MTHEEYVTSVRKAAATTARAMLDGHLGFLEGARKLASLSDEARVGDGDQDFSTFIGIDSCTDAFPLGQVRDHWDPAALEKLAPEIAEAEAWAKEHGKASCLAILERFGAL